MRYASVCSGIEAATVAWHPLGWSPVWFSQFDPENNYAKGLDFPSEVLKYHYPNIPNLGDMTKLRESKIYQNERFELIVGGTPCQSFSIAGLRGGLGDERGNLALEFVRILIDKQPKWFVFENVPGVLTSGKEESDEGEGEEGDEPDGDPRDFACLLSAWTGRDIAPQEFEKGGVIEAETEQDYSVAWRIFDSQYFGVPQRRRRIFVVGYLGKNWRPPVAVLFEQDSLRRDFTPGGKKRKGTTKDAEGGAGMGSESVGQHSRPAQLAPTLNMRFGDKMGLDNQHINIGAPLFVPLEQDGLPAYRMTAFGEYADDGTASTLKKRDYKDATDLVLIDRAAFNQGENALYDPKYEENPTTSPTIIKRGPHAVCPKLSAQSCSNNELPTRLIAYTIDCRNDKLNQEISGTLQAKENGGWSLNYSNPVIYDTTQVTSPQNGSNPQPGDPCHPCHPLVKNGHVPLLIEVQPILLNDQGGSVMNVSNDGIAPTLRAQTHGYEPILAFGWQNSEHQGDSVGKVTPTFDKSKVPAVQYGIIIRRTTPMEHLRLQGFPDDYLKDVPGYSDAKAYAACGNSMTTFVMRHIGKRIDLVDKCLKKIANGTLNGASQRSAIAR